MKLNFSPSLAGLCSCNSVRTVCPRSPRRHTVVGLLEHLVPSGQRIGIEFNEEILPRSPYWE